MIVTLTLYGALGDAAADGRVTLTLDDGARVADARQALTEHARAHWSDPRESLLARSAFASDSAVLREHDAVPDNGQLSVLPPVNGG